MPKGAVLGAWALLLVAGRWRRGRDGLDRAGRLLGWAWLGLIGGDVMRACLW